ncbi:MULTISPECIES: glyoxalase/bleomycin resistance/extradiol dioxygenase family protein [Neisseria]|uniref:VOC family protein n=1 Tax=Neisseria TaxID=482 RepID=UPI0006CE9047|nr:MULTISPECIES: VOC family protein [Neisseria]KPN71835.1 hypothetical protein AKG09_03765 [Neisseria sp. 83E34]
MKPIHPTNLPPNTHTVNSLIITEDTRALIDFLTEVFGAVEDKNALAYSDSDGKIFNSSVTIGDTSMIIFDRKDGWRHMPSLLQVYVTDIEATLARAVARGATVTTEPTDFYGGKLARFVDPQNNLWWLFELGEYDAANWENSNGIYQNDDVESDTTWKTDEDADPDMRYIHDSLVDTLKKL